MSALSGSDVLRPGPKGLKRAVATRIQAAIPFGFRVLRRLRPILALGSTYVVTLHDDVREVLAADGAFHVPYKANLDVITGGEPFFLGMADTPEYRAGAEAMRLVIRPDDLPALARSAEALSEAIVSSSGGRIEVVDQLVRRVTFDMLSEYFGVPEPPGGRLDVWATRLFEFQFVGSPKDTALRAEVAEIAPAFRAHLDRVIAGRKELGTGSDDVLGRCLLQRSEGRSGFGDVEIRTAILCMIVGGPPQPPMVVPHAMEQLLRRPDALASAVTAARRDEDASLRNIVREAMRFDPLAPGLPRVAVKDCTIARGTRRQREIPKGATVIAAIQSAMMDGRRLPEPDRFDPDRRSHEYMHFGHGLHQCFGRHINDATLHMMLKPLLKRHNLRREPGPAGRLSKNGAFAERLVVRFD